MKSSTIEKLEKAFEEAREIVAVAEQDLEGQCEYARRETAEARQALATSRDDLGETRHALEITRAEAAQMRQERDQARAEQAQSHKRNEQLEAELKKMRSYNQMLREKLLELYSDLRAKDLPTLILRLAMNLVGAENALFTDATGTKTMAAIGLNDLKEEVSQALYAHTQQAAESEEPIVRNDSQTLPDGRELVNLAALPVAIKGVLGGVILVANRRDGEFDEEQTDLLLSIGKHASIALENHRLHEELRQAYITTVAALADAIEVKDPYTRGHCEGVAQVAVQVAEKLGWEEDQLEKMRYAALLHDIGKIGVPDGILLKPGKLLPDEFKLIQQHSQIGSDIVAHIGWLKDVQPYILHHHERMDGSGYPDGLAGDDIPLGARIIGVVDALDAMTTTRPYRNPVPVSEALEELRRCADVQFDKNVVDLVAEVLEERREQREGMELTGDDDEGEEHGSAFSVEAASKAARAATAAMPKSQAVA